jgi:hypothetical protein
MSKQPLLLRPDRFTDLVHFPSQFKTVDEALQAYNEYGAWQKVQFKVLSKTQNQGLTTGFTLACSMHGKSSKQVTTQGLQLRSTGEVPCPVQIKFRWNKVTNKFKRGSKYCMHHSHDLALKTMKFDNRTIANELKHFVQAQVPT